MHGRLACSFTAAWELNFRHVFAVLSAELEHPAVTWFQDNVGSCSTETMRAHLKMQQEFSQCTAKGQIRPQDDRKQSKVRHHGTRYRDTKTPAVQVSGVVVELVIKTDII